MVNAERRGKRQVLIRPSSKVVVKFLSVMQRHGELLIHKFIFSEYNYDWRAFFDASFVLSLRNINLQSLVTDTACVQYINEHEFTDETTSFLPFHRAPI